LPRDKLKYGACGFDANSFSGPIKAAPQTDVSASKNAAPCTNVLCG
jgi:hypothetical protein